MDLNVFSEQNLFIFILPGFITVWSFRYFTNSKKTGDFEFLALAFIWGIFNLMLFGLAVKIGLLNELPNKPAPVVSFMPLFSIWGFLLGLTGAQISKWGWFQKLTNLLKSNWIRKYIDGIKK